MPHYDYECSNCKNVFEVFQKMTDEPVFECPKCKSKAKRLIGAGCGLIFKGKGFYITDYKKTKHPGCSSGTCSSQGKESKSNPDASESKEKKTDRKK
jgi:putative FmdB family regulatory protein